MQSLTIRYHSKKRRKCIIVYQNTCIEEITKSIYLKQFKTNTFSAARCKEKNFRVEGAYYAVYVGVAGRQAWRLTLWM
jgi:hypothetical protein